MGLREVVFSKRERRTIKSLFCSHVWTVIVDSKLSKNVSLIVWECTSCKVRELWILRERKGNVQNPS